MPSFLRSSTDSANCTERDFVRIVDKHAARIAWPGAGVKIEPEREHLRQRFLKGPGDAPRGETPTGTADMRSRGTASTKFVRVIRLCSEPAASRAVLRVQKSNTEFNSCDARRGQDPSIFPPRGPP